MNSIANSFLVITQVLWVTQTHRTTAGFRFVRETLLVIYNDDEAGTDFEISLN